MRLLRPFRPLVKFFSQLVQHYSYLNCQLMAAGISFYALLSLIPLLLLAVSVLSYFLASSEKAVVWVTQVLTQYFPSASDPGGQKLLDSLVIPKHHLATGIFGFLALTWSGMRLFDTLERALTTIWTGGEQRSLLKRQLVTLLILWAAAIAALLSLGASLLLAVLRQNALLSHIFTHWGWRFYWRALALAPSFIIVGAAAFFLYWLVPKSRVPWKAALVGALPAAVMWEIVRQGFAIFFGFYNQRLQIYGGLASAVLLAIWVYCCATVILWGAAIAHTYQDWVTETPPQDQPDIGLVGMNSGQAQPAESVLSKEESEV